MPEPLLTDLAGLSKPLTKLVEAVQASVGTLYEPRRIRNRATAEAEALLILADAEGEVAERTARRLAAQEMRRQKNIDSIVAKSVEEMGDEASDEPVDPDWMSRFFSDAADVSDEQMQTLWARLLAGEVAQPCRFSRRTLSILKEMSATDADRLQRVSKLVWETGNGGSIPLDGEGLGVGLDPGLGKYGVQYADFLELNSLGLLQSQASHRVDLGTTLAYSGHLYVSCAVRPDVGFAIYPLSQAGLELYSLTKREENEPFHRETLELFRRSGVRPARLRVDHSDVDQVEEIAEKVLCEIKEVVQAQKLKNERKRAARAEQKKRGS